MRYSLLAVNVLLLGAVVAFVVRSSGSGATVARSITSSSAAAAAVNPLDQLSSADIAANVAQAAGLPEATAVTNEADTEKAELAVVQTSASLVAKPQVVATAFKSNQDIQIYITKPGDTIASIAAKFHVTSDSVRWSNSLNGSDVGPNQRLYIPPVNGMVYVVRPGDTPTSLAVAYHASAAQIIAFNDAEISGLKPGVRIVIPNAQQETATVASDLASSGSTSGAAFPWGGGPIYGYNGYDYGFCTWYVASRIAVPSNWGNASSWSYYAALSGWTVSSRPSVGAIAQTPYAAGGEGHVAIVEAVSADGSQIKYSDMNGLAGWGAVGYSGWVSASTFPNYITH